jgi:hypothetical protein
VVDLMLNKYKSGNANVKGVYFDEENRRHLIGIRSTYATAALAYVDKPNATKADTATAVKLLKKCDELMDEDNLPYGMMSDFQRHNYTSMILYLAAQKSNYKALADKIINSLTKDYEQQKRYYQSLPDSKRQAMYESEIPSLISVFLNSRWEISGYSKNVSDTVMTNYRKDVEASQKTGGDLPMPFITLNSGKITAYTSCMQFSSIYNTPDFDQLFINFRQTMDENGFNVLGMMKPNQKDIFLETLKTINGFKFDNNFNTLILTKNGTEVMRFKRLM